ncbi:MAG: hypothetical protein ACYSWZ_10225 [Planctomycetota bacterium]
MLLCMITTGCIGAQILAQPYTDADVRESLPTRDYYAFRVAVRSMAKLDSSRRCW